MGIVKRFRRLVNRVVATRVSLTLDADALETDIRSRVEDDSECPYCALEEGA